MSLSRTPSSTQETHPIFQTFLNPAERIIWSGKPRQGLLFRPSDIFFVPFSIVWTALAVWWELENVLSGLPFQEKLWGVVMLSVAAYILLLRFLVDLAFRYLTFYGLTNQRVLIHTGLFKTRLISLPLADLREIHLDLQKNGWGQIVFGPLAPNAWMQTGGGWIKMDKQASIPAFELLKDPQKIYKQILAQQKKVK
ncbi:MAG: hypothetical protein RBS68_09250 [Anaerolineales bacterium]|jgi:hypothetical protein|nr:hypothetical protein [Anaerolineales bacterium]